MRRLLGLVSAALAMLALGAASANADEPVNLARMTIGYTYFNRPHADEATHDAAVKSCAAEAEKMRSLDEDGPEGTGIVGALITEGLKAAYHHAVVGAALEDCMVARGWRVVLLPDAEGKEVAALPQPDLKARLSTWIGAETPHGTVSRVFANDLAKPDTVRFAGRPNHLNNGQLSLKSATGKTLGDFPASNQTLFEILAEARSKPHPASSFDTKWSLRPIKPADVGSALKEGAVLIFRIKGTNSSTGGALQFWRMGKDRDDNPAVLDHAPVGFLVSPRPMFSSGEGGWSIYVMPPGRWRIHALIGSGTLSFCLGAPYFEALSGEVIYGGTFDVSRPLVAPDLDLQAPRALVVGQAAAAAMRPAKYINGSEGQCSGREIYALEFDGAPFLGGYTGGSAAWRP